jgi:hypothetical protein
MNGWMRRITYSACSWVAGGSAIDEGISDSERIGYTQLFINDLPVLQVL